MVEISRYCIEIIKVGKKKSPLKGGVSLLGPWKKIDQWVSFQALLLAVKCDSH